jgi:hypothetical protein
MDIRIRKTGQVMPSYNWMEWVKQTHGKSLSVLTLEALHHFGSDPVLEGAQPITEVGESVVQDGVENINGQWFTKYKAVKDNQA